RSRYPADGYNWIDIIAKECFQNNLTPEERTTLATTIEQNPTEFLFLLDGYDELLPEARDGHLEPALSTLYGKACCLTTSRPEQVSSLKVDSKLEVMGFTDSDIETYVERFLGYLKSPTNPETVSSKTLVTFLKQQPMIWSIAHIPLQLSMI